MKNSLLIIFALLLFSSYSSHAFGPKEYYLEQNAAAQFQIKQMFKTSNISFDVMKIEEKTFEQKLEHTNPQNPQTFKQRYWTYSHNEANSTSPVFYKICGESRCAGIKPHHYVYQLAQKFKGHIVVLEHRYYGDSQPFATLETENLSYLSTQAALQDLANVQTFLMKEKNWNGPWITIGGSYAGSLSAYYRLTYPNLVVGALASSAPVQAKADFEEYDASVTKELDTECLQNVRTAVQQIENALNDSNEMAKIKRIFDASDMKNDTNFLFAVADMASAAIQYGSRKEFCNSLKAESDNLLDAYAKAGKKAIFYADTKASTFEGFDALQTDEYRNTGWRQWGWQFCTEYGYYQVAHSNPNLSMRSALITTDFHDKECNRIFGVNPLDTTKINETYFKPLLNKLSDKPASHILFTNGSTDPWKELSLTVERGNNTNPLFSYYTIQDAAHCDDLFVDSNNPYVLQAQSLFEAMVKDWIQNFDSNLS